MSLEKHVIGWVAVVMVWWWSCWCWGMMSEQNDLVSEPPKRSKSTEKTKNKKKKEEKEATARDNQQMTFDKLHNENTAQTRNLWRRQKATETGKNEM